MEKDVERWVGEKVKEMGGLWLKFVSPGHTGVPDRLLILHGTTLYVEMKDDNGRLSSIQKATLQTIAKQDVGVHVVYGRKGAEKFIQALKDHPFEWLSERQARVVWTWGTDNDKT